MPTVTYTIRIDPKLNKLIEAVAEMYRVTRAELTRQIHAEGLQARLDPDAIDARCEQKKQWLHAVAAQVRAEYQLD